MDIFSEEEFVLQTVSSSSSIFPVPSAPRTVNIAPSTDKDVWVLTCTEPFRDVCCSSMEDFSHIWIRVGEYLWFGSYFYLPNVLSDHPRRIIQTDLRLRFCLTLNFLLGAVYTRLTWWPVCAEHPSHPLNFSQYVYFLQPEMFVIAVRLTPATLFMNLLACANGLGDNKMEQQERRGYCLPDKPNSFSLSFRKGLRFCKNFHDCLSLRCFGRMHAELLSVLLPSRSSSPQIADTYLLQSSISVTIISWTCQ